MTYLLTVAVLAGAPHAPAARRAAEHALLVAARPLLLTRLQGEWDWHAVDTTQHVTVEMRIVFRGDTFYHYGPYPIFPGCNRTLQETVCHIDAVTPTTIARTILSSCGRPVKDGTACDLEYAVRGDKLVIVGPLGGKTVYTKVPPGRTHRPGG
jgi:hypothetical protein